MPPSFRGHDLVETNHHFTYPLIVSYLLMYVFLLYGRPLAHIPLHLLTAVRLQGVQVAVLLSVGHHAWSPSGEWGFPSSESVAGNLSLFLLVISETLIRLDWFLGRGEPFYPPKLRAWEVLIVLLCLFSSSWVTVYSTRIKLLTQVKPPKIGLV